MARVIAVATNKGGVGKTTTVAALGHTLTEAGRTTLMIDLDPQANLTSAVGGARTTELYDTLRAYVETGKKPELSAAIQGSGDDGPFLLGNAFSMANLEVVMARESSNRVPKMIVGLIAALQLQYDYILLDCPPSLGKVTTAALVAATDVLIPVVLEPLPVEGLALILRTIAQVKNIANPPLRVAGVIPTMVDPRNAVQREMLDRVTEICNRYRIPMMTLVPRRTAVQQAVGMGKPITKYSRAVDVARAYEHITRTLIMEENK